VDRQRPAHDLQGESYVQAGVPLVVAADQRVEIVAALRLLQLDVEAGVFDDKSAGGAGMEQQLPERPIPFSSAIEITGWPSSPRITIWRNSTG